MSPAKERLASIDAQEHAVKLAWLAEPKGSERKKQLFALWQAAVNAQEQALIDYHEEKVAGMGMKVKKVVYKEKGENPCQE